MIPERLHGLFPLPLDDNELDQTVLRDGEVTIFVRSPKSGGKPVEKPIQPKQGKDVRFIIVRKMQRPTKTGK